MEGGVYRQSTRGVAVTYAVAPLIDQRRDPVFLTGGLGSGGEGDERAIAMPRNLASS